MTKIESIYECQWKQFKKDNSLEIEIFWLCQGLSKLRPLVRLTPRACLRGAFVETYCLRFTVQENPNYDIFYGDANSLYPYISTVNRFPTGKYKILLEKDNLDKHIQLKSDGHFYYKDQEMSGDAAHVTILPPSNLYRPYLSIRAADEHSFISNCFTCTMEKTTRSQYHKHFQDVIIIFNGPLSYVNVAVY